MSWRWPLPAFGAWALCWAAYAGLVAAALPAPFAAAAASALGAVAGTRAGARWRRVLVAVGFPLSFAVARLDAALPAWSWLLPLAVLALVYPLRAWGDAPLFPTPRGALGGLSRVAPLHAGARVLDAGCGLGDGLAELRREYPGAALHGLEWSAPLRALCAWRCRFAQVRRGDIWAADWSGFDLVYLFQRPGSVARALDKARRELRAGAWLASLEFDAGAVAPTRVVECADGRRLWLYRMPAASRR